jgi:hypothetical protein
MSANKKLRIKLAFDFRTARRRCLPKSAGVQYSGRNDTRDQHRTRSYESLAFRFALGIGRRLPHLRHAAWPQYLAHYQSRGGRPNRKEITRNDLLTLMRRAPGCCCSQAPALSSNSASLPLRQTSVTSSRSLASNSSGQRIRRAFAATLRVLSADSCFHACFPPCKKKFHITSVFVVAPLL